MTHKIGKAAPSRLKHYVDWGKVEADYRAGVKTNYAIADEHGISEALVRKRAKRGEWTRDLTDKIKTATRAAISTAGQQYAHLSESEIVALAARLRADIVTRHQERLATLSIVADKATIHLDRIANDPSKLGEVLDGLSNLVSTTASIIKLERQAFNIDAEGGADEGSKVLKIERVIIDVAHSDGASIPSTA